MPTRLFRGKDEIEEVKEVENAFDKEKELHALVEKNLPVMFPRHIKLKSEFVVGGLRIDTVAFDEDVRSFVIIEYKNIKRGGAIDQGMAYLQILDDNQVDFLRCYQKATNKPWKVEDIAWNETRVVVIAPSFTPHQLYAARRTKDPIELYRITKYKDDIIALEKVEGQTLRDDKEAGRQSSEEAGRQYVEDDHLAKATNETEELYNEIKAEISKNVVGEIVAKPTKTYIKICLAINDAILCTVDIIKNELNLCYTTKELDVADEDRDGFVKRMVKDDGTPIGKQGLGDYRSKITSKEDVKRAMRYIEAVHVQKVGSRFVSERQEDTA